MLAISFLDDKMLAIFSNVFFNPNMKTVNL